MYSKKISMMTANPHINESPLINRRKVLKNNVIVFSPRKDSSDGVMTYFETYPHNQVQRQHGQSIQFQQQQSICASIQNGMIDGYLDDLKEEIKLKSEALVKYQKFISVLEQQLQTTKKNKQDLNNKLIIAEKKNAQLQSQLYFFKNMKTEESARKILPRTKTYMTEKNISTQQLTYPLQLISSQIFSQFAQKFQSLLNQLSQWTIKERQQQIDGSFLSKLDMHRTQVEDLLYGKSDDQYSKTTFETLQLQSNKKKNQVYIPHASLQYEQTISMYKQYCNKLSMMLYESVNCIQQLSKNLQKTNNTCFQMSQPHALIPQDLIRIIVKECKMTASRKFIQLKMENAQLTNIVNQMIDWIHKNAKESPDFLKYSIDNR